MSEFGGVTGASLGPLTSNLGSYNGSRSSSTGGSGSGGSRGSQLVTLRLDDFLEADVGEYETDALTKLSDVPVNVQEEKKGFLAKLWETGATITVGFTSIVSGIADVVESVVDGGAYVVAGAMDLIGLDDAATATREFIARDLVTEANDALYGEGGILAGVNEASSLKYDSAEAQVIRSISEKVATTAAATAATVCTCGVGAVVAPLALGFASGVGNKAEQVYQDKGTDISLADNAGILLAGVGEAANWYAQGKLGQGALKTLGAFKHVKTAFKALGASTKAFFSQKPITILKSLGKGTVNLFKGTFNKTTLSRAASKSIRDIGNIFESIGIIADDAARWINGDEKFDIKSILAACGELGITWVGNVTFDALGEYLGKLRRVENISGMSDAQRQNLDTIFDTEHQVAGGDGKYESAFKTYREHAELHTQAVRDYAVMLGLDLDNLDDKALAEIYYGAYFHDLGMSGGGIDAGGNAYGMVYDKQHNFVGFLDDTNPGDGFTARKNHPLNSAVAVLTTDLVPEGMDKDKIALLALSHSKSTSGVTSFADTGQWLSAIDELDDAVNQYNIKNSLTGADAITFDADRLKGLVSDPNSQEFKVLVDEALCIRDGDAISNLALDNGGHTIMQTGNVAHIESPDISYDTTITKDAELAAVVDTVKTPDGQTLFTVDDPTGKMYHAGEENVNFDSIYDGHKYTGRAELVDPHKVPNSSIFTITERLGEAVTYTNCERTFIVDIPKDMAGTALGDMYVDELKFFAGGKVLDARSSVVAASVKLSEGKITQGMFDQIKANADSIENFYSSGIIVEGYGQIGFTIPTK